MKKLELLKSLGFEPVEKSNVLGELNKKTTKVSKAVVDRINNSTYYDIFRNGDTFTVDSHFLVTKQEISQLSKVLGATYIRVGTLMDKNGLWMDWIKVNQEHQEEVLYK